MASAKQILANKKNARRSTGPKTKLGKEKVSINAMKLGIYAEHHVMVGEDHLLLSPLESPGQQAKTFLLRLRMDPPLSYL